MKFWKTSLHILIPIIAALITNAIIYFLGWNNKGQINNKLLPPGYVIGIIWIVILGLLGLTHFMIYPDGFAMFIVFAVIYCLAYPFLTSGLRPEKADVYNLLAFVIAVMTSVGVYKINKKAVWYTLPFVIWTLYVSILTVMNWKIML